jgi:hypothetical protein
MFVVVFVAMRGHFYIDARPRRERRQVSVRSQPLDLLMGFRYKLLCDAATIVRNDSFLVLLVSCK